MAKRTRSERDTAAVEVEGEDDVPEIVRLRRKNMARNAAMMAALNVGQVSYSTVQQMVKRRARAAQKSRRALCSRRVEPNFTLR